jgi:hypothetical protein
MSRSSLEPKAPGSSVRRLIVQDAMYRLIPGGLTSHGEESPRAGDALQVVFASVLELDSRPGNEHGYRR